MRPCKSLLEGNQTHNHIPSVITPEMLASSKGLSPDPHSSLSPTICRSAGFLHLLTALNRAGVSTRFGFVSFFGFQASGGSARHFSPHSARFWACFSTLSAVACDLHALCAALRSLRALAASLLLSLAAIASSSSSNAEIIASPVRICPELVYKSCWEFFFQPFDLSLAAKASHNLLQWTSWRTLCARVVW